MALVCRGSKAVASCALTFLVTAIAVVTSLGVFGAILVFAYATAAAMLIGLIAVASSGKVIDVALTTRCPDPVINSTSSIRTG